MGNKGSSKRGRDAGTDSFSAVVGRLRSLLPSGRSLPDEVWQQRHRFLLGLTWFHAIAISLTGPLLGYSWEVSIDALFHDGTVLHTVGEGLIVALFALLGGQRVGDRSLKATLVGFGLMSSSAILVHLSGGYIEFHFHFFVMLVFIALYQDWAPYLLSILYVAVHHGVVGVMWPEEVYNHAAAINAPWTWAGVHAFFVLWSCVGSAIAWRFNEKAHAQTKLVLDSVGEGIYGLGLDGKATFVNPAVAKMLGYDIEQLIGRSMHDVLHHSRADGTSYPREECPIYAAFKDGTVHRVTEEVFWRKDGTSFPVDYVSTPIFERGELRGAVVTFQDVTDRMHADKELRAAEHRFRGLVESAPDAIVGVNGDGLIVLVNAQTERRFGYSRHELLGQPVEILVPEDLRQAHVKDRTAYSAAPRTRPMGASRELCGRRKDGSKFPVEISLSPMEAEEGPIITAIIRDITGRKQAQDALAERAAELARSNQELEQFAYVASHDLQEPLRMVANYTQLLVKRYKGKLDPDADEFIGYAAEGATRMQGLINDLLVYSRVGTREKPFAQADCETILMTALRSLQFAIRESGAIVTHDPLPNVICDEGQLGQLIQNLIGNGIKFQNSKPPVIHVSCKKEGPQWVFFVKDNGIGVDPQYAERIFVIFQRLHAREEYPGTGIGLAVCKKIVERHGGRIWVESKLGEGATFFFTIPAVAGEKERQNL